MPNKAVFILKHCLSIPKLTHLLRSTPYVRSFSPDRCRTVARQSSIGRLEIHDKTPLIYSVSYFNLGELGALLGGTTSTKVSRGDATGVVPQFIKEQNADVVEMSSVNNLRFLGLSRSRNSDRFPRHSSTDSIIKRSLTRMSIVHASRNLSD